MCSFIKKFIFLYPTKYPKLFVIFKLLINKII